MSIRGRAARIGLATVTITFIEGWPSLTGRPTFSNNVGFHSSIKHVQHPRSLRLFRGSNFLKHYPDNRLQVRANIKVAALKSVIPVR